MASLVEELVTVLEEEEKIYQTLISYGEKKTDILIRADVPELEKLTCLEQLASDDLVTHSNQQVQLLKDIANVLGRTEEKDDSYQTDHFAGVAAGCTEKTDRSERPSTCGSRPDESSE